MKPAAVPNTAFSNSYAKSNLTHYFFIFLLGAIGTLGFAPAHLPGFTIISIALLYNAIINAHCAKQAAYYGLIYGLGYFGIGVSWVIISIHDYGNLNYLMAGSATLLFLLYLALYPACTAWCYRMLALPQNSIINALLFSTFWCLSEYLRATLLTGFPWLLLGTSQIDSPLKFIIPVLGIYGSSFLCVFAATLLVSAIKEQSIRRYTYIVSFVLLLMAPSLLSGVRWTNIDSKPISVGVIQANLAMRDKWDDSLFWNLLDYYEKNITALLGTDLIILPESAIPLPANYLNDYLLKLDRKAKKAQSSLVLGILQPTDEQEHHFYNSIVSLGQAKGSYIKEHLVPFGEYIPAPFKRISELLQLEMPNIAPGPTQQQLITLANHPVASLICYELAYPELLRAQMPRAQWIISISDDGWFGHSLASYQQQQIAQSISLLTGRFQITANNDGLSSIIDPQGDILDNLPPFSSGILQSNVFSASGTTPWIVWGDAPVFLFCLILTLVALFFKIKAIRAHEAIAAKDKRRYP